MRESFKNEVEEVGGEITMLNIRQSRKLAGLTQAELSSRTGIGLVRLSFLENGYRQPSAKDEALIRHATVEAARSNAARFREIAGVNTDLIEAGI
jgi:transcriptional regulator with XRE-family HTH domain